MASFKEVLELNDPSLLTPVREFEEYTVVMQTLWPNLMGPAGFVSIDDGEVMEHFQDGVGPYPGAEGVLELGGRGIEDEDHMVTEASISSFYTYYREVMGL